jgi:hypothetical protein
MNKRSKMWRQCFSGDYSPEVTLSLESGTWQFQARRQREDLPAVMLIAVQCQRDYGDKAQFDFELDAAEAEQLGHLLLGYAAAHKQRDDDYVRGFLDTKKEQKDFYDEHYERHFKELRARFGGTSPEALAKAMRIIRRHSPEIYTPPEDDWGEGTLTRTD